MKTHLFSAMKDEGPFIVEWVAYHRAIGFSDIHIAANDCADGSDKILKRLADLGKITYHPNKVKTGESPQANAAKLFNKAKLWKDGDWSIWLDADEFLNIHVGRGKVGDLIKYLKSNPDSSDGIFVPWRMFGTSGQKHIPTHMIDPGIVHCAPAEDQNAKQIKMFFQNSNTFAGLAQKGIHRPLVSKSAKTPPSVIGGAGLPIDPNSAANKSWLAGDDRASNHSTDTGNFGWGIAQINHYAVKSEALFDLKKYRGRGWSPKKGDVDRSRHTKNLYLEFNKNRDTDTSILRHAAETRKEERRLLKDETLRCANLEARASKASQLVEIASETVCPIYFTGGAVQSDLSPTDQVAFEMSLKKSKSYLEYGLGATTLQGLSNKSRHVFSVDCQMDRIADMRHRYLPQNTHKSKHTLLPIFVGQTDKSGFPSKNHVAHHWLRYATTVWADFRLKLPDLILINGRFRLGCFLAAALFATQKTTVLFANYLDQALYRLAETLIPNPKLYDRMARFDLVPNKVPKEKIAGLMHHLNNPL